MGSSSSRPGSHPPRQQRVKRSLHSFLVCGGSSISQPPAEMEDDPTELVVHSAHSNPVSDKFQRPKKKSSMASRAESKFSRLRVEHAASPESNVVATDDSSLEDKAVCGDSDHSKSLSQSKEITTQRRNIGCIDRDIASTSYEDPPSGPISADGRVDGIASNIGNTVDEDVSDICLAATQSCIPLQHESGDPYADGASIETHLNEAMSFNDTYSASSLSDSPVNFDLQRNNILQDETALGLEYVVSDREQGQQDQSLLQTSISPNILSGRTADIGNHEARQNSRRLFWDAFSRRSSRRHSGSRTFLFTSDNSDELGSNDRWLLDFNSDLFDDGVGSDTGFMHSRVHNINERRWHSGSEIWERLRGGHDGINRQPNICPSGVHPNGTCTCDSILMAEDSGAHASISRIVMLAEALFEVLDEIHRQPVSFSLSLASLPAPECVVDSLPVKNHIMTPTTEDDAEQCYICLSEYEEGDKIRVLPCHHEYHLSCVDKWLKEIHGVCPLCRGDVREGFSEGSVSNPEIPSLQ